MNKKIAALSMADIQTMFKPIETRRFEARCIEVNADLIEAIIQGRNTPVTGYVMSAENTDNPQPLEIVIEKGEVQQFRKDKDQLFIHSGVITITSVKEFVPLKQLRKKASLESRTKDPDLVKIDERTFHQIGTFRVRVSKAHLRLKR